MVIIVVAVIVFMLIIICMVVFVIFLRADVFINRAAVGGEDCYVLKSTADVFDLDSPFASFDRNPVSQGFACIGIDYADGGADSGPALDRQLFVTAVIFHFLDNQQGSIRAGQDNVIAGAVAVFINTVATYFSCTGIDCRVTVVAVRPAAGGDADISLMEPLQPVILSVPVSE